MKSFNKLYGLSLLSLFMCFAACTSETVEPTPTPAPEPSGQAERRNVLLTLENKLSVAKTKADTKAETIATADENKISSLDIYVFGSKTEDGTYTYQERFCYRENSSDLPPGSDVTAIDLNAIGDKGTETTALLSLKKGLFVKLYCIANQSKLIDPANGNEFNSFVPLIQSNPGQAGNTVTEGIPVEADFKLLQSIQLDPTATDLLLTPLPMTGAYTTPLDLTDFSVSARLQLGFRLTRSVARFDIVNDAKTSKFTIQSVSMANGRKGVSFFPLTVTGKKPATAGDLITYPARKFDGEKANEGTCTGAFYSWPSPLEDAGYLILSGTYAANATENIPVTYKVPFKPAGEGNYIEVAHNHRYTVAITAADEYHLDFTITVADWTDEGSIDEYQPGGDADANGVAVNVDGVNVTYDAATRTVTMPVVDDTKFTIEGASAAGYYTRMYYENEDTQHQWLIMTPTADNDTKADAQPIIYTIQKDNKYKDTKYPVAFIRFTDKISAKETVVIVQPFARPSATTKSLSDGSTFTDNVLTLYQTTAVSQPTATLNIFSSGGSKLDFTNWNSPVGWFIVSPAMEQDLVSADYILTLNSSGENFPDPYPLEGKEFTFSNKANTDMKETITLKLKSELTVTPATEGQALFDNSTSTLRLYNNAADKVKLTVSTIGGSEVVDKPEWLTVTPQNDGKNTTTYSFYVAESATTGVNSTFKIRSKADNSIEKTYKVYSINKEVTFTDPYKNSSYTSSANFTSPSSTVTYFPCNGSYFEFKVNSPKGVTLDGSSSWAKLTQRSETTLANGQKQTTVRLERGSGYSDASYNTIRGNLTFYIKDKYSNNTTKKTLTVKQYDGIVYPGSNIPAKRLSNNGINWWVAMENANNGNPMYYTTFESRKNNVCPSGWRVPSSAEYRKLWNSSGLASPHSNVSSSVLNNIFSIYGKAYIRYYSIDWQLDANFRCGMIPVESPGRAYIDGISANECYIRCVKNQ